MPNLNFAEALSFFDKALSENYSVGSKPGTSFQTQPKLPEQILYGAIHIRAIRLQSASTFLSY